ncbi:MAG: hypothetical protein OWS74_03770, partial [Firmicutes bacterium]|nr:hypothetical protein [Bacillota bacterium]
PIGHSAALLSTLRQYKAWADKFSEMSSRLHTLPMAASDAAYERLQSDRSLMLLLIDADALLAQITATAPHLVDLIEQADPSAEEKSRTFLDDLNHALSQRKSLLTPVF